MPVADVKLPGEDAPAQEPMTLNAAPDSPDWNDPVKRKYLIEAGETPPTQNNPLVDIGMELAAPLAGQAIGTAIAPGAGTIIGGALGGGGYSIYKNVFAPGQQFEWSDLGRIGLDAGVNAIPGFLGKSMAGRAFDNAVLGAIYSGGNQYIDDPNDPTKALQSAGLGAIIGGAGSAGLEGLGRVVGPFIKTGVAEAGQSFGSIIPRKAGATVASKVEQKVAREAIPGSGWQRPPDVPGQYRQESFPQEATMQAWPEIQNPPAIVPRGELAITPMPTTYRPVIPGRAPEIQTGLQATINPVPEWRPNPDELVQKMQYPAQPTQQVIDSQFPVSGKSAAESGLNMMQQLPQQPRNLQPIINQASGVGTPTRSAQAAASTFFPGSAQASDVLNYQVGPLPDYTNLLPSPPIQPQPMNPQQLLNYQVGDLPDYTSLLPQPTRQERLIQGGQQVKQGLNELNQQLPVMQQGAKELKSLVNKLRPNVVGTGFQKQTEQAVQSYIQAASDIRAAGISGDKMLMAEANQRMQQAKQALSMLNLQPNDLDAIRADMAAQKATRNQRADESVETLRRKYLGGP